jgi:hypothetical protein
MSNSPIVAFRSAKAASDLVNFSLMKAILRDTLLSRSERQQSAASFQNGEKPRHSARFAQLIYVQVGRFAKPTHPSRNVQNIRDT